MKNASLILITLIAFVPNAFSQETYSVPEDILVFDVWEYFENEGIDSIYERADALYFITSLQGIVNRDAPRLYLLASLALFDVETKYHYDKNYKQKPVTELDKFWLAHFRKEGYFNKKKLIKVNNLKVLVSRYSNKIKGLSLWDMQVPATSNVALLAAGCEGLLPVSKDLGGGKFYDRIKKDFPFLEVKLDLTGKFNGDSAIEINGKYFPSTGSAKNDCYRYIIERYLRPGRTNPYRMWFNCDASMWGKFRCQYGGSVFGYLGDRNELQQNGMYNADYWIAQKAIVFDLSPWADCKPADDPNQPIGTDNRTWHDILEISYEQRKGDFGIVGGFVPWWIKYTSHTGGKHDPVPTEWEFVALLTSYNMGNDGDAAFGLSNASFFQHLPAVTKQQSKFRMPEEIVYNKDAVYIAFLMLDYDGSAWLNQMQPSIYNDSARGKIRLNWCINPALNLRVPHAIKYLYDNKTPNDYLGFSGDGVSYIHPDKLFNRKGRIKESGASYYEKFARKLNHRFGVRYNVFHIDSVFNQEWAEMAARISPNGFGTNLPIGQKMTGSTPVTWVETFHIGRVPDLKKRLAHIYGENILRKQSQADFHALRCILITPSMIYEIVKELELKYPKANVEIVDVPNYFKLLKHKLTEQG